MNPHGPKLVDEVGLLAIFDPSGLLDSVFHIYTRVPELSLMSGCGSLHLFSFAVG